MAGPGGDVSSHRSPRGPFSSRDPASSGRASNSSSRPTASWSNARLPARAGAMHRTSRSGHLFLI
jgi:hypothetical protein